MNEHATRDVARQLGLSLITLKRYIAAKKIPVPPLIKIGNTSARLWSDRDVERVRELLPKIRNGRKTRHKKIKKRQQKKAKR